MSTNPFADPGSASGISWEGLNGSLLLIEPISLEEGVKTVHGDKNAVRAKVAILDGPQSGEEYTDTLIFPLVLQGQLRGRFGQKVIGRLGQGEKKAGQKPPWKLLEATAADREVGMAYLNKQLATPAAAGNQPPF